MDKSSPEYLKYCAARDIYRKDNAGSQTNASMKTTSKKKKQTVAEWFEMKFGEDYYQYIKRMMEAKRNGEG